MFQTSHKIEFKRQGKHRELELRTGYLRTWVSVRRLIPFSSVAGKVSPAGYAGACERCRAIRISTSAESQGSERRVGPPACRGTTRR